MNDTAYHSPINIDGISKRKQEGPFICSPIGDNRVSFAEQMEEGQILGAAKWLVYCVLFTVAAAGSALFV